MNRLHIILILFLLSLCGSVTSTAFAQREAKALWWDRAPVARSEKYFIKTDLPVYASRRYARHLDRVYHEFAARLAAFPPRSPEKLNVYIFADRAEYVQTMRARFGIDAAGTGGMFFVNSLGEGLALWTGDLSPRRIKQVIQHEGFHQFAYSRFGADLPMWVNEGLAEFFGEAMLIDNTFLLGQSTVDVIDKLHDAIENGTSIPLRRMLTLDGESWSDTVRDGRAAQHYHQAWSMVQFLVYGEDGRYRDHFERYLRLINNGTLSEPAFEQVFGPDIEAFEKRWKEYVITMKPSAVLTALERIEFLAEGALALSRQKEVPESLEELKRALREIDFRYGAERHGRSIEKMARDDELFTIPIDNLTKDPEKEPPMFIAEKPDFAGKLKRELRWESKQPTPTFLRTEHLEPRELVVVWVRDDETGELSYEIVARAGSASRFIHRSINR